MPDIEFSRCIAKIYVRSLNYPNDTEANRNATINREWKPLCMIELDIEDLSGKEAIELAKTKH